MTPKVAVIGAGLAGLTAARQLVARNVEVIVIDKGRRGGGRMCTRKMELPDGREVTFDIGPPILYADLYSPGQHYSRRGPSQRIPQLAHDLPGETLFQHHEVSRIGAADEPANPFQIFGLAANGGMRELPFRLLAAHSGDAIAFHDHTIVERLVRTEDGWKIHTRSLRDQLERVISAHGLILTPPVPQTLELLECSKVVLPDDLRDILRRIAYSRCIAIYGVFTGADQLQSGGVWLGDGPFEWITDNHLKEVSAVPNSITALTTSDWAEVNWNRTDVEILNDLLPRLQSWVGTPIGATAQRGDSPRQVASSIDSHCIWLQRWKWAKPLTPTRPPCLVARDLATVFAGDGFAATESEPVDAAIVSGEAAANRMSALLSALARKNERYTIPQPRRYTLEIAVSSPDEASQAALYGADRIELSSGLDIGGLTPSLGLFRAVRAACNYANEKIPIYVLLRPRGGDFTCTNREFDAMQEDARLFLDEGASGIVFGILTHDGAIDHKRCRTLVELAQGKAVFHRAFDFLSDPLVALDELIELGFERVLTSGGASTAEAGTVRLAALVQHAGWQIEVLPAGSIRPENVADLVRATRCDQVHAAVREDVDNALFETYPRLAAHMGRSAQMSAQLVERLRHQLDQLVQSLS